MPSPQNSSQAPPAQSYPVQMNYPEQGYPQQGYHQQGYPQQGFPAQYYPQQRHSQGYLNHQVIPMQLLSHPEQNLYPVQVGGHTFMVSKPPQDDKAHEEV